MNSTDDGLSPAERDRFEALRSARSLADLVPLTDAGSEHDAYFAAKREWRRLMDRLLPPATPTPDRLPGDAVEVDGDRFVVHGVTHADTGAERAHLREHVSAFLEDGATAYCEQGIRSMYFDDMPDVRSMDDYRWALERCREMDIDSHLEGQGSAGFEGLIEDLGGVVATFREAVFSLVHSGADLYGEEFAMAMGDVAADFLMTHEDVARAREFEAFVRSRRAAEDPAALGALQRYYETVFLPQPLEREWLRRHDTELEVVSHGRSERMADYAVYHGEADTVHLVVGAAHQPGIVHYLERHRDGHRRLEGFEVVA
jgi:hypothetical protein